MKMVKLTAAQRRALDLIASLGDLTYTANGSYVSGRDKVKNRDLYRLRDLGLVRLGEGRRGDGDGVTVWLLTTAGIEALWPECAGRAALAASKEETAK